MGSGGYVGVAGKLYLYGDMYPFTKRKRLKLTVWHALCNPPP